ncbi:helix-turn-helix domain-containing protein [Burkholderia cenocepacia]|uniref:helix-turn-helix domain-containing protein n=1 Tax=Burkholderia cepacia complex TaxID=87882 RepID=UPI000F563DB1|nr:MULTISPECIES: helix-turn-helix domain-containing protein [Burkholderia cepacia complex]ELW9446549.1 helix-turn-helix domain-containing protein [Burkholderia cenocepacia]MBR8070986.1 helix-turn-helix domain-containing protein [Burkholderia cenocepacia]MBR8196050.1 helix-turn-helix domain-containing protein [Burkholderia cenocepacia]MBR8449539.1 helix-turn-helix domain-containing protein [Burkholderia cenocepacia]MBR8483541.1 helix-turn-helix domain-containing protein [Burkholderia cenocepaci
MSEPQPSNGAETNAAKPAPAGLESLAAVGSRLAQLRETKGWSVDDVSARLKVAPQKLRALESGDISHLPGVTFALGVVRSYAKMLGVDPEPFAQALRRERGVPEVDLSMPASSGTDLPRGRVSIPLGGSSRHHPWLWGTGIVIVAVVAVLMWHTGGDSSSLLARFKGGEAEHASAASATAASSSAEEAATNGASAAVANEVPAPAAASTAPAQAIASAVPAPAAPVATAAASQPVAATAAASAAAPAQPASVVVAAGQSMVELKVKQDCWFSVRDKNGKELFSALVRAGETKQVAGDGPFKVTIGNKAGLDAVAFDGKPVDPAKYSAARGNVARFTLP